MACHFDACVSDKPGLFESIQASHDHILWNGKLHYRKWFNILNEMQDLTGSLEGIISIYKYMSHSIFEMSLTAAAYFYVLTIQHLTSFKYCTETYAVQCCKLLIKEPATSHTFWIHSESPQLFFTKLLDNVQSSVTLKPFLSHQWSF